MTPELTIATISAAAVIIAALIGFIVAITTSVIAKEQKVSEFRQSWINELRKDVAFLLTIYNDCLYHVKIETEDVLAGKPSSFDDDEILKTMLFKIIKYTNSIKLRLNPESDKNLINEINKMRKTISLIAEQKNKKEIKKIYDNAKKEIDDLELNFHYVLKGEWERVKKGERNFVLFRSFGEVCLAAFITAFFVALAFVKIPELAILLN